MSENDSGFVYPCMPVHGTVASLQIIDNDESWACEEKRNGWRCLAHVGVDGIVTLWSRHKKKIDLPLLRIRYLLERNMPRYTLIDGELTRVNSDNWEKDRPNKASHVGAFYPFDVIRWGGKMVTGLEWQKRHEIVMAGFDAIKDNECIELPVVTFAGKVKRFEQSRGKAEGVVCKRRSSRYPVSLQSCPELDEG